VGVLLVVIVGVFVGVLVVVMVGGFMGEFVGVLVVVFVGVLLVVVVGVRFKVWKASLLFRTERVCTRSKAFGRFQNFPTQREHSQTRNARRLYAITNNFDFTTISKLYRNKFFYY
jgi:hypothetical protein